MSKHGMGDTVSARLSSWGSYVCLEMAPSPPLASADPSDRNARAATITAQSGSFRGVVSTTLWLSELERLRALLVELEGSVGKDSRAEFRTLEGTLALTFALTPLGHLRVGVEVRSQGPAPHDARLRFTMDADQSFLPGWIAEATRAIQELTSREERRDIP